MKYLFLVTSHMFLPTRHNLNHFSFKNTKNIFVDLFSIEKIYSIAVVQRHRRNRTKLTLADIHKLTVFPRVYIISSMKIELDY